MKSYLLAVPIVLIMLLSCRQKAKPQQTQRIITQQPLRKAGPNETYLKFDSIPYSDNDFPGPGRGGQNWNDQSVINVTPGNDTALDRYYRFAWNQIQNDDGKYNWAAFDLRIQVAIKNHQKFSFGIMPTCEACSGATVDGVLLTYPLFLHTQMQAEAVKDWPSKDMWVINWNSVHFLSAWKSMLNAVADHITANSYNGIAYKNVIGYVDVRGYGNFGEWHNYPYHKAMPSEMWPTAAVLDTIISSHIQAFPRYPLVILIGAFDDGDACDIPPAVTYYALSAKNSWGHIGWRRDNWGDPVNYTKILENNRGSYNGLEFKTAIMDRYMIAPVTGEPLGSTQDVSKGGSCAYWDLENEVRLYHASSFGNGNIPDPSVACVQANIRAASKASGYRMSITGGYISTVISAGGTMAVTLNWFNAGVAPVYENWNTTFELRTDKGMVAWTGTSSFNPKLFLPGSITITDGFNLPAKITPGIYSLYLIMRDPDGYRKPLPLAIAGRNPDGSYLVAQVKIDAAGKQ